MQNIYTVAQVNAYIKNMFTQDYMLQSIFVKGEVSNCKYHSSGHIYFTLKDLKGTITCVMFAGNRTGLQFQLKEGQQIVVAGSIDVFERDGKYQLYAKEIMLDGTGVLYEKFEQLKIKLEEKGMFDVSYKQKIPSYIKTLGIVTASTGAAVRDIIQIANRRNPYIQIILYPAIVQGEQAAVSIVKGIHVLEQKKVDLIIVGRGGGSMEDLWAFNEEIVAQAIFDCSVPIISAVGHETDTTIADFVADLRAPTPSAAAEIAVYDCSEIERRLWEYQQKLNREIRRQLAEAKNLLQNKKLKVQYRSPANQLRDKRMYLIRAEEQLSDSIQHILEGKKYQLALYLERLRGLSPLEKLNQGFSYTTDSGGYAVTNVDKVFPGDQVHIQVKNGNLTATITDKEKVERY